MSEKMTCEVTTNTNAYRFSLMKATLYQRVYNGHLNQKEIYELTSMGLNVDN